MNRTVHLPDAYTLWDKLDSTLLIFAIQVAVRVLETVFAIAIAYFSAKRFAPWLLPNRQLCQFSPRQSANSPTQPLAIIDHEFYPHIFAQILSNFSPRELDKLRLLSRQTCTYIDLKSAYYLVVYAPYIKRVGPIWHPCLSPKATFTSDGGVNARARAALTATRTMSFVGAYPPKDWFSDLTPVLACVRLFPDLSGTLHASPPVVAPSLVIRGVFHSNPASRVAPRDGTQRLVFNIALNDYTNPTTFIPATEPCESITELVVVFVGVWPATDKHPLQPLGILTELARQAARDAHHLTSITFVDLPPAAALGQRAMSQAETEAHVRVTIQRLLPAGDTAGARVVAGIKFVTRREYEREVGGEAGREAYPSEIKLVPGPVGGRAKWWRRSPWA